MTQKLQANAVPTRRGGGTAFLFTDCAARVLPCIGLSIKVVDSPHGFHIADCYQVTLGGGKIRMPEDRLTHDFC